MTGASKRGGVVDSLLDAMARKAVWIELTDPLVIIHEFNGPMHLYELSGEHDPKDFQARLTVQGLIKPGQPCDIMSVWREIGDAWPHDHLVLGFRLGAVSTLDDAAFAVQVDRSPAAVVIRVFLYSADRGWTAEPQCLNLSDGAARVRASHAGALERSTQMRGTTEAQDSVEILTWAATAVLWLCYLLHHRALEPAMYEMAAISPGQRRYNDARSRKMPPVSRTRVLDLSRPKIERIPVGRAATGSGSPRSPHDKRGHLRRFNKPTKAGKTEVWVKPCKIKGGFEAAALAPPNTIVKLPDAAEY